MLVFCYRLILREEAELQAAQGESYARYRNTVPRLWPSVRARVASSGARASWPEGFKAEGWYWGLALSVIAFAVTLNLKLFFWMMGGSLALFWVSVILLQRKSRLS